MTLDLFSPEPCENLLPYDGEVQDYGCILSLEEAEQYYHYLYQHLAWKHDEAKLYGKHFITARKVAWYGDCLLYTSPSPRDLSTSRMPSSA